MFAQLTAAIGLLRAASSRSNSRRVKRNAGWPEMNWCSICLHKMLVSICDILYIQVAKTHPGYSNGWRTHFFTSTFMSMRVLVATLITICKCCRKIQSNHSQKTFWPLHPYLGQKLTAKLEKEWLGKWSRSSASALWTLLVFDACCRLC